MTTPIDTAFPPLTPCMGVCRLDVAGLCIGCRRTMDEIARWGSLDDAERTHLMDEVLPQRELLESMP